MRHLRFVVGLCLLVVSVSSCALFPQKKDPCAWDKPIYWNSAKDNLSQPTAKQIVFHNDQGRKYCGWKSVTDKEKTKDKVKAKEKHK